MSTLKSDLSRVRVLVVLMVHGDRDNLIVPRAHGVQSCKNRLCRLGSLIESVR
jgi:hypothetical protein